MGSSGWLATTLDQEMLEVVRNVSVFPRRTPPSYLWSQSPELRRRFPNPMYGKTAQEVAGELGNRYLLYYLRSQDVGRYVMGRNKETFVTPTPYSPEETASYLALPRPDQTRDYVLLVDVSKLSPQDEIYGPRWTALGAGIEYILRFGFGQQAIVAPHGANPPWEILVR